MLSTDMAKRLYHEAAARQPIFDYHCHLNPREIAENRRFDNLADIWLGGDHYKWRQMRANGISEELVTRAAEPFDKFMAWAHTVPRLIGNPLYHWTHLELRRYFDINETLNPKSAPAIWKAANEKLASDPELSVFGIFEKMNVSAVGTTDDPADSLEWHGKLKTLGVEGTATQALPSFRPDRIINITKPDFAEYVVKLGESAGTRIGSLEDLLTALRSRIDFFDRMGCVTSDHGLDFAPFATASSDPVLARPNEINFSKWESETAGIFALALEGKQPNARESESWKTFIMNFLGGEYADKGWAMQLHVSALRNNNSAAFDSLGADTGFDAAGDGPVAEKLSHFMDLLYFRGKLPKIILYSINIKDFYPMATLAGCFQGACPGEKAIPGKIQLGSSWWFLDHIDGMEAQIRVLANTGLLSRFVGMLTDSRSFLSYPRHEYFRRILCNILGAWAENGEAPDDFELLAGMARDISFENAQRYFARRN